MIHSINDMKKDQKNESFFRKEFIKHNSHGIDGDVWIGSPRSWKIISLIAIPLIFLLFGLAATSSYAKKEQVVGRLVPPGGIIRVIARSGGVITDIAIKEGDRVYKQQLMARLSLSPNIVRGNVGISLEAEANSELSALEMRDIASRALLEDEKNSIEKQRDFLVRESLMILEVRKHLKNKEILISTELERLVGLQSKGFVTLTSLDSKKSELLAAQQADIQNTSSLNSVERQINEIDARLKAIPNRLKEQHSQKAADRASIRQKLMQVEAQTSENVVAPISGIVAAIQSEVGQTLASGGVIAILTAESGDLQAELYVPSRAIGFVKKGQDVALHFQAFPYQRYGAGKGKIISVSRTVIAPSDTPALGLEIKEPVFMIKVLLNSQIVQAYGENIKLQPGMLLNANIIIERRNLFQLLFDPILALGDRT